MEEFLTATILSGFVYDTVKTSAKLTLDDFKVRLKGWLMDDITAQRVVNEINKIPDLDDYSEKALTRKLEQNEQLIELLKTIKVDQSIKQVIQNHSGSGDNVAGDKHVTYKANH